VQFNAISGRKEDMDWGMDIEPVLPSRT